MPRPSLAQRVLDLVEELEQTLFTSDDEEFRMTPATRAALILSLERLRDTAKRRIEYSADERTRRDQGTAGSVMAPRGARD